MTSEPLLSQTSSLLLNSENPWPGLAAYDEASQNFFHGRNAEVAELLRLIRLAPLTVLYGKSGLGKSSLLQAGLFPLLRANYYMPVYLRLNYSQEGKVPPLEQAAQCLSKEIERVGAECPMRNEGEGLWEYLHRKDMEIWSDKNFLLTPVLVFDQFEELFSLTGSDTNRIRHFFDNLGDLIENRIPQELTGDAAHLGKPPLDKLSQQYRIILSFREDYLPEVKSWEEKVPSLLHNDLRLKPMTRQCAIEAIKKAGDAILEEGLAPFIVDSVGGLGKGKNETEAIIEPVLLSLFCYQLNLRRSGRKIDKALVKDSGKNILTNFYLDALQDEDVKGAPDVSLFIENCLIQGEHFRGAYPKVEALSEVLLTTKQLETLTSRRRLLRVAQYEDTARIELIHDCLVPIVRKARDERKTREQQTDLEQKLGEANTRAREKEKYNRQLLRWRKGLVVAVVLSLLATIYAVCQKRLTLESNLRTVITGAISASYINREIDPQLSTLMAVQAVSLVRSIDDQTSLSRAESALRRAINYPLHEVLDHKNEKLHDLAFSLDGLHLVTASGDNLHIWDMQTRHEITPSPMNQFGGINKISFSSDGKHIVVGGGDEMGSIRLWDVATGKDETPKQMLHGAPIKALSLGPRNLLATGNGKNGRIIFWNVMTGDRITELPSTKGDESWFSDISINSDGSLLAVGEVKNGKTTVWDITKLPNIGTPSRKFTLQNWMLGKGEKQNSDEKMLVNSVAFSTDGRILATGDRYNTANLWNAKTGSHLKTLYGPSESVRRVAISQDGSRMATASDDGTVNVWDPMTGQLLFSLSAHNKPIEGLLFSPNGNRLATASQDKTVKIWKVGAHSDAIFGVAFSPDGKRLATASGDKTIKIWEVDSHELVGTLIGHKGRVLELDFSPNGKFLASASEDKTAGIWNLRTNEEILKLQYLDKKEPNDKVFDVTYSLDGKWLATAGANFNAVVWDASTGAQLFAGRHDGMVSAVAFSPDSKYLASAGWDKMLKIWEIPSGSLVACVQIPKARKLLDVNFSPRDTRLVITTGAQIPFIVDDWSTPLSSRLTSTSGIRQESCKDVIALESRELSVKINANSQAIDRVQFTPDGKNVIAGGEDREVKIWDVVTGEEKKSLRLHNKKVNDFAISSDGKWIATASQDGTFNISPFNTDDLLAFGCGQITRRLSDKECMSFLGSTKCPPSPCDKARR